MTEEQKAAVINARAACAMIRAMGMQAENEQRKAEGFSMAYTEKAFFDLIAEEGIHWNAIHPLLFGTY